MYVYVMYNNEEKEKQNMKTNIYIMSFVYSCMKIMIMPTDI